MWILMMSMFIFSSSYGSSDKNKERLSHYLAEPEYHIDPNDMFIKSEDNLMEDFVENSHSPPADQSSIPNHNIENHNSKNLEVCLSKLSYLESQLKNENKAVETLLQKLSKENIKDVSSFYERIIHKFMSILNDDSLTNDKTMFTSYFSITFSKDDIELLRGVLEGEDNYHEVDSIFSNNLKREYLKEPHIVIKIKDSFQHYLRKLLNYETWLYTLWILLVFIALWGFSLFILDIQQKLRWRRVIFLLFILCFVISCVMEWKRMIKVSESKHLRFFDESYDERRKYCSDDSWWSVVRSRWQGISCKEYRESILVSADEQITPLMVLSETLSRFILLPLEHIGKNFGLFFIRFYEKVPWYWQIQATILFIIIFFILVLATFGYGIHFPFFLGGIHKSKTVNESDRLEEMIKESEERMKNLNRQLVIEAKKMLNQISREALEHMQKLPEKESYLKPVIKHSASTISKKLEDSISENFKNCLSSFMVLEAKSGEENEYSSQSDSISQINLVSGKEFSHQKEKSKKNHEEYDSKTEVVSDLALPNDNLPFISKVKEILEDEDWLANQEN